MGKYYATELLTKADCKVYQDYVSCYNTNLCCDDNTVRDTFDNMMTTMKKAFETDPLLKSLKGTCDPGQCIVPTATPKPSTPTNVKKVSFTTTIKGIDLKALEKDAAVKKKFVDDLTQVIVDNLGSGYDKSHVKITLKSGSVVAEVEI